MNNYLKWVYCLDLRQSIGMVQILDRSGHPTVIFNYWAQKCPGVECLKTDAVIEKTAKNVKLQLKAMYGPLSSACSNV